MPKRVRTVEYEPGWGWIARNPKTGKEILDDFRWASRSVARSVVRQSQMKLEPYRARRALGQNLDKA